MVIFERETAVYIAGNEYCSSCKPRNHYFCALQVEHMDIKAQLASATASYLHTLTGTEISVSQVLINQTDPNFTGDYTVVLFPLLKLAGKKPEELGELIGHHLVDTLDVIDGFNIVKGFLNLEMNPAFWNRTLQQVSNHFPVTAEKKESILIEYPSPNTNKPLHLGHLRNIFLGFSLTRILQENGHPVIQTCLYNDRGTNISKSMLMYQKATDKKTPENSGIKPDHLVAEYYVQYNDALKAELKELQAQGLTEEEAKKQSTLEKAVADLTIRWEQNDPEVRALWEMMNGWFYQGVQKTFDVLGLSFDRFYYESDVYDKGRQTVKEGLDKGVFFEKPDGSVWIDLTDAGLDEKLVLRSNGTTVYITQDMALVYEKQREFDFSRSIYVVGNEQEYHFKVLFEILRRLGLKGSEHLYHLSYGMVELPTGKMKSREGTVVDADDLVTEVIRMARETADEQGKLAEVPETEKEEIYRMIGLGALRYFILKVDPKKKMIFNPEESIDFNGNTAPFIQYTYARTCSLLRNAVKLGMDPQPDTATWSHYSPSGKENTLVRLISEYPAVVKQAAATYSPALVANYIYELASAFNGFYHDHPILKEENAEARGFRLTLARTTGNILKKGLYLLGIDAPERM